MTDIKHIAATASRDYTSFDVVIVGSGASGSIAARTLAEKGFHVALLEYGALVSPGALYAPNQATYSKARTSPHGRADGNPWTACAVGGGMQFYNAIMFRYRQADLSASQYLRTDMEIDWPISLLDLEPFYSEIESLLEISGTYGFQPYPASQRGLLISNAMRELGITPKSVPLAIRPPKTTNGCIECSSCNHLVCPTNAKANILAKSVLDDSAFPGSISVLYGCFVNSIELRSDCHAEALECYVPLSSQRIRIPVKAVIVCANAIQSAALMLRSKSRHAPTGIGNDSDLVGRGLSFKISGYSVGYVKNPAALPAHWGPHATVYTDDFYEHPGVPCRFGGLIYEANLDSPGENIGRVRLHYIAGEEPWSHNRVMLDSAIDPHGIPYIRIAYKNSENDRARISFLANRAEDTLRRLGASCIERMPFSRGKGSSHLHGTMRAGSFPKTSVVDHCGKIHGLTNIYVMDGSVMNFAGNSHPTHTIMANAKRMALSLAEKEN
ncbi:MULTISPECIES: GMC oxidoreductase [Cupriavidus]|uniref:Sugar-alcohol dehydrogenase n=4 Tax=Cupriavidus TaxID=106589 RepID=B2AJE6_CUPTR|nr:MULTISPECIES: GMC family oxidoreductase [Cupriavidus]MCO4865926.1 GMC family oxidoreductase [Cupriavidus sp. WGlv3]MCO4893580.1 GMC family oxidoreductase [Cupriavidus sp. WGtm5]ULX55930.1 alcohol dehydrogenase [Cupriavidus taiwanensis]CAP64199.1 putative sugar-alcohol dehydrogenase [Cupriavidus taiwanensis LMG 19424]SPC23966.1 putative sugar-alcohol dehydrogenase [Cupriavidus taiwanensis]